MADIQKWLLFAAVALFVWLSVDSAEGSVPPLKISSIKELPDLIDLVGQVNRGGDVLPSIEIIPFAWSIPPDPPKMFRARHVIADVSDAALAVDRDDDPLHEREFGLAFVRFV